MLFESQNWLGYTSGWFCPLWQKAYSGYPCDGRVKATAKKIPRPASTEQKNYRQEAFCRGLVYIVTQYVP